MTIKDIARLAGVSISTVSKIVNRKDSGIKDETRERVLNIVKKYRYKPYDFIRDAKEAKKFLIGLLFPENAVCNSFTNGFLCEAEKQGYQVQVCVSSSVESEYKHIAALCKNRVDGIVWEQIAAENASATALLRQSGIPFCLLNNYADKSALTYDFETAGYKAAEILVRLKHSKIYCVYNQDKLADQKILKGLEKCLFKHRLLYTAYESLHSALAEDHCSAVICCGWDRALEVYEYAQKYGFSVPANFSLLCVDDEALIKRFPAISSLVFSLYRFGRFSCTHIINVTEKKKTQPVLYGEYFEISSLSIDLPGVFRKKRIIVAGSINMDILLSVKNYPQMGETISAGNISMVAGGKGINQAVGAAKLGAKVSLIGSIGRDHDGTAILDILYENAVDTSAVFVDAVHPTGKAYIHVQEDGESGIVLYAGANQSISRQTIASNESLFSDAGFCLLQTEIPMPVLEYTAFIAKKNNVKIMLKPSAIEKIDDKLLEGLDYFIPNRKELNLLCPHAGTVRGKADWFLQKGVKTVIVTLGSDGCYVKTSSYEQSFPAADIFIPVDTTGAADAFIAALAVFLSENRNLPDALICAIYAAGFSTTRVGVVPSLIDRATLEHFTEKQLRK